MQCHNSYSAEKEAVRSVLGWVVGHGGDKASFFFLAILV